MAKRLESSAESAPKSDGVRLTPWETAGASTSRGAPAEPARARADLDLTSTSTVDTFLADLLAHDAAVLRRYAAAATCTDTRACRACVRCCAGALLQPPPGRPAVPCAQICARRRALILLYPARARRSRGRACALLPTCYDHDRSVASKFACMCLDLPECSAGAHRHAPSRPPKSTVWVRTCGILTGCCSSRYWRRLGGMRAPTSLGTVCPAEFRWRRAAARCGM